MATGVQAVTTSLSRDEQLRGRQNVRYALRNLTSDIQVFYNPKLNLDEMNDLYDRPLDIVLFHKTKGLLGLVIKSGEIVEESGDLVSQYQPTKQYYKIIDPLKQVQKAMLAMIEECEPSFKEFVPLGVAVIFPDTNKADFSNANPLFMFQENLNSETLQKDIEELFAESWDHEKSQKYSDNAQRINDFLKNHSDNDIQRVERKETLTKLGVKEDKKAYHLPQKAAPVAKTAAAKPAPVRRPGDGRPADNRPATVTEFRAPQKNAQPKVQKRQEPKVLKPAIKIEKPAPSVTGFLKNIQNRVKDSEQVEVSGSQWGMMIAIAAIIICVAYFIGRNAGIIMRMH